MKHSILALSVLLLISLLLPFSAAASSPDVQEDWDDCVESFLTDHNCPPDFVALGYRNTVTGEEHFYRGDSYMETGSIYKIPLNMVYARQIWQGDMSFDTRVMGIPYETMQQATIVRSDNYYATLLWQNLGPYSYFRDLIAPFMGVDPENVDPIYYENRFFTARQVIHCLQVLYENPEQFPGILDCMLQAEPEDYFCQHPQSVPVAHKYGYWSENGDIYVSDCGICYTEDPILICMFTMDIRFPNQLLADYCTLMCDYARRTRDLRLQEQAVRESAEASAPQPVLEEIVIERPLLERPVQPLSVPLALFLGALCFGALILCILLIRKEKARPVTAFAACLLLFTAAGTCLMGQTRGLLFVRTDGDPRQTVECFFDRICQGDYEAAGGLLNNYSSLGALPQPEETPSYASLSAALRDSFSYELVGECRTDGLSARQQVRLRYLELPALSAVLQQEITRTTERLVEELPAEEIYGDGDSYRPDFAERVWQEALQTSLSRSDGCIRSVLLPVDLSYLDGNWAITADASLLTILSGGSLSTS